MFCYETVYEEEHEIDHIVSDNKVLPPPLLLGYAFE